MEERIKTLIFVFGFSVLSYVADASTSKIIYTLLAIAFTALYTYMMIKKELQEDTSPTKDVEERR